MKYLVENKAWDIVEDYNVDKILYLLVDRATIKADYYIYWKNNRHKYYRDYDLPAYIWHREIIWYIENYCKRYNHKPAIIHDNGNKTYQ